MYRLNICPSPVTLSWFKSYLSNCVQTTILNNYKSDTKPISTGVPQGSILGPLLFILYVNNLPDSVTHSSVLMYADDTVLYTPIDSNLSPLTLADYQNDLNNLASWCFDNKLSVNASKTKTMPLGVNRRSSNKTSVPSLTLNKQALQMVSQYKYLGILLNPSLTLSDHILKTIGHVTGKINTLSTLCRYITHKMAITIYKGTILPLLEYANVTYTLISASQRHKLQRLQNRALRVIFRNSTDDNLTQLHLKANLGTLAQRSHRQLLCLMYRRAHLSDLFPSEVTCSSTRTNSKIKFVLPRPSSERFKQFPLYYGAEQWDKLEVHIQKTQDYDLFKMRIPKKPDFSNFPIS